MKKPIIGLTPTLDGDHGTMQTRLGYAEAVEHAGGVPLLLPPLEPDDLREAALACGGLLFTGGVEVHPAHYREGPSATCGAS